MKAVLQSAYGAPVDVLRVGEIAVPVPADNEILVRVRAASVHPDVWHVVTGFPRVLRLMGSGRARPKNPVPGTDMAGVVEAAGKLVTRFAPGDEVFGETVTGMQWMNGGTFAEFVCVHEDHLERKPGNVSFEQAASVSTAGLIVLNNLRNETAIRRGMRVLINGAGGGVGSLALQIAKAHGAHVTAVDKAAKQALLLQLGADVVVDYMRENVLHGTDRFDLVFDVASTLSLRDVRPVLTPGGKYVIIGHDHFGSGATGRTFGSIPRMIGLMARTPFDKTLPKGEFKVAPKRETMPVLRTLMEQGHIAPVIDRTYPLEGVVDALIRLESGEALGRLVITP